MISTFITPPPQAGTVCGGGGCLTININYFYISVYSTHWLVRFGVTVSSAQAGTVCGGGGGGWSL